MWSRVELKGKAKEALKRNYWKAVLIALFLSIVTGGIGSNSGWKFNDSNHSNYKNSEFFDEVTSMKDLTDENKVEEYINQGLHEVFKPANMMVVAVVVVVVLIIALLIVAIVLLINAVLINPLVVGIRRFFVQDLSEKAMVKELAYGFDNNYKNIVVTMFFRDLFTFLWFLLLIIPGIVKAYEYRMIPYIMGENPNMDRHGAFALSKEMMTGQKWNAFVLDLSFIGWHILSLFTFGLLNIFYVAPYKYHTSAALYNALKKPEYTEEVQN